MATTYESRMAIANMLNGRRKQAAIDLAQSADTPDGVWPLLKQGLFGAAAALLVDEIGTEASLYADMLWEG